MRRIGIDVGGTNTDAALVEGSAVLEAVKRPTTDDVLSGVVDALGAVSKVGADVAAVVIGTTHFTNAVVQRKGLNRVGFLRLALPTGRSLPPLVGWPADLADAVAGESIMVRGGIEFDGRPFEPLDESEVVEAAKRFADAGLDSIVVAGSFSPVDSSQEDRAAELIAEHVPGARVTVSHRLGRLGLLERENAAGLNACLMDLAETTIQAFADAMADAGFGASTRLLLTQNDGTMLALEEARKYPVLTFASGPTNSMRGAALLSGVANGLVVDVGGTTADFGALVAGYPRQANAAVEVGGVRTLFQLPDLLSIGLGGGSRVRTEPLRLGPDSVGQHLLTDALVFGGTTPTLTDAAVATGALSIDNALALGALMTHADAEAVLALASSLIADGADRMKLSADHAPLIAVGGGAFAVPDQLAGISEVIRPDFGSTANAVGAALAEVSGEVDQVFRDLGREAAVEQAIELATERAIVAGADAAAVQVIEIEDLPLAYLAGDARRIRVRVVAPFLSS
ncbi:MAG: N-methylhydantoinase A/oxoprolinase/acetone carboxylase beta subunit [Acidimicrobiales bacterium]|jgi:N-methylhydantoinase A/oxoprolinase/acetone carboxylase beta subunit